MKETAVEWLFEKLWDEPKDKLTWYTLRHKAIEIEKEQTEISDEEIAKSMSRYNITDFGQMAAYMTGAKWYRDQLKKQQ